MQFGVDAAADALRIPVRQHGGDFTDDALDVLVTASGGYPYFLQEFGKAIWNLAPEASTLVPSTIARLTTCP
ncbi:hypothetical protein ACNJ7K_24090 [Rhodococcus aetherivorans]